MNTNVPTVTCPRCDDALMPTSYDVCADCMRDIDAQNAATTPPAPPARRYVTSDQIASDIRDALGVAPLFPATTLCDVDMTRATRDAWGAGFLVTTSTGQTFRVVVTEA